MVNQEACEQSSHLIACWGGEVAWDAARNRCLCVCDEGWYGRNCQYPVSRCRGDLVTDEIGVLECNCDNLPKCESRFFFLARNDHCRCTRLTIDDDDDGSFFSLHNSELFKSSTNYFTSDNPDYFPLIPGNKWLYESRDSAGTVTERMVLEVQDSFFIDNNFFYEIELLAEDDQGEMVETMGPVLYHEQGEPNEILFYFNENQNSFIGYHTFPSPGNYTINGEDFTVEATGNVTVPAGTFENCMSIIDDYGSSTLTYAPDVGLIRIMTDGVESLTLSAYKRGCTLTASVDLFPLLCGSNAGGIALNVQGAVGPINYNWSGPVTIGNVANPSNLVAGTYSVTVSDDVCSGSIENIVLEGSEELQLKLVNIMDVTCKDANDGMIEVSISGGTPPYLINWNNGQFSTSVLSELPEGVYDVTITDADDCTVSESYVIGTRPSQLPMNISAQGLLTDLNQTVLPDGFYQLTFRLYSSSQSGASEWQETQQDISITSGIFSTILGSVVPLNLCFDRPYYLGIEIDDDGELTPRIELTSSPYAFMAKSVEDGAIGSTKLKDHSIGVEKIIPDVITSVNGITNDGGDVALKAGDNIQITNDPEDHSITISVENVEGVSSVEADQINPDIISSLNDVSNDAGNIDLVAGDHIEIIPDDLNNQIVISALPQSNFNQYWQGINDEIYFHGSSIWLQRNDASRAILLTRLSDETGFLGTTGSNGQFNVKLSSLSSNPNKGFLTISGEQNETKAAMYAGSADAGVVFTNGANGNSNTAMSFLSGNANHGFISVKDSEGSTQAGLYVDSNGDGRLFADIVDSFVDHPTKSGTRIRQSYLQGPEAGIYLRGTAELKAGRANISFPEYFREIISKSGMTIVITPLSSTSKGIAVVEKSITGFEVEELFDGSGSYQFDWEVKAVRKRFEKFEVLQSVKDGQIEKGNN